MAGEYFKKRAGTTDRGKDYEDLFIANIVLDFILDDEIEDFKISSNDESFGAFDDIVLEIVRRNNQRDYYALQLKHSARPLTLKNLIGKSGDFSIKKYFDNFMKLKQSSYKWILLTNRTFNYIEKEAQVRLEGDDFDVKILKYLGEPHFMNFCQKRNFYQFCSIVKFDIDIDDGESYICYLFDNYKDFFQKFFLCTDQLDVLQVEEVAFKKFTTMFSCNQKIFRDYYKFITDWSLKEGKKVKLNKSLMKQVIANQILSPFIKVISPYTLSIEKTKIELFVEVLSKFHVTFFEEDDFKILEKVLGEINQKCRQNKQILQYMNISGLKHQVISKSVKDVASLTNEECNLLLWMTNYCHLVVTENESVYKAVGLCHEKKFIVLCHQRNNFQNLADINHSDIFEDISKSFKCELQGKQEILLESLLNISPKIQKIITTSQLLRMVDNHLVIGEKKEDLPVHYIRRSVSKSVIDFEFLNVTNINNTLIIITGLINSQILRKHISNKVNIIELDLNQELSIDMFQSKEAVYFCENCSKNAFDKVCDKSKSAKCHQFRFDDGKLEWVRSKGGVSDLKKFLIEDFQNETELLKEENSVNIICADAGMGKTVLLKNLKNTHSSEFWTILIYPKDHSKYFRENGDDDETFFDYVIGKILKEYTDFDKNLLKIFFEEKRVVFLWDALDETSDDNLKIILNLIDKFWKKGYKQWITSRNNLEPLLENRFSVLSRTIREFDEEEQRNYIRRKLKVSEDLEDIFQKINKNVQLFRYNKILGIPLQIYMFTELLIKDLEKYKKLLDKILSLASLYECFVDEKFNLLHQEKENYDGMNDMVYKRNKEYKEDRIKMYEKVAMKLHFKEIEDINCDSFLEKIKTQSDSVGIITHISEDNVPDFWHNSYGEYFAASYLSKHIKLFPNIIKLIFDSKYTNVRFFFDLIMAKEHPAHISVLYKNVESLRSCEEEEIKRKDRIGRNPLQLACSSGEQFLDLHPEKCTTWIFFVKKYKVYGIFAESVKQENPDFCKVLEDLIEKNDPNDRDDFGFDSFKYADQAKCLVPLSFLSKQYRIPFDVFDNFKNPATVLYYAAVFDLVDLLDEDLPIVEDEFENSVLFAAVKNGSFRCLQKLTTSTYYKKVMEENCKELVKSSFDNKHFKVAEFLLNTTKLEIDFLNNLLLSNIDSSKELVQLLVDNGADANIRNGDGNSALNLACLYEKTEIVQFLISRGAKVSQNSCLRYCGPKSQITQLLITNGANVNIANSDGKTAIQHAAESGFWETLKVLVDNGAKVNDGDKMGCRPIHYACIRGRRDVIEKLVDFGADVNVANDFGFKPLHYACGQQHVDIVEFLIENGAVVEESEVMEFNSRKNPRIDELLKRNV